MSSLRTTLALALGAAAALCAPVASAQETTSPGIYREGTYDTRPLPKSRNAVGTTTITSAEYNETTAAERERTVRPNRAMLITGGALVVAPYVAGVIVASQSDLDADKRNFIPVVGPWLDLGQRPCAFGSACTTSDGVGSALLVGSGVAQGVGILLAAVSFAVPERRTERVLPEARVVVVPVSFARGGGLGAIGTF